MNTRSALKYCYDCKANKLQKNGVKCSSAPCPRSICSIHKTLDWICPPCKEKCTFNDCNRSPKRPRDEEAVHKEMIDGEVDDDIKQALEASDQMKRLIQSLGTKISELQKKLRTRDLEVNDINTKLQASNTEISRLQALQDALEKKNSRLRENNKNLIEVIQHLKNLSDTTSYIYKLAMNGETVAAISHSKRSIEGVGTYARDHSSKHENTDRKDVGEFDKIKPKKIKKSNQISGKGQSKLSDCKQVYLYYPRSSEDAVEVTCEDMACLEPQKGLRSGIMDFYIRYLQQQQASSSETKIHNCHFFSTYFYGKLKENYNEDEFNQFQKWWKNVDLTKKVYIFVPINEGEHWTLAIICKPQKENKLVILHMDSLVSHRLHDNTIIFDKLESFLKKEWSYRLSKEIEIDVESLEVPQQENGYDCGLFVLSYLERFLKDAPDRLTKEYLLMFNKKKEWFLPKEAFDLRLRIRSLLEDLKEKSPLEDLKEKKQN